MEDEMGNEKCTIHKVFVGKPKEETIWETRKGDNCNMYLK
jgi:hypothetical protein